MAEKKEIEEFRDESIKTLTDKTGIEQILASSNLAIDEERSKYLGVNRIDVLYSYKIEELELSKTYKSIKKDMSNVLAERVLIRGILDSEIIIKIMKIAKENQLPYSVVKNPEFQGDLGLVIVKK